MLSACRKNVSGGGGGGEVESTLDYKLWLLDAPVASEINARCIHV